MVEDDDLEKFGTGSDKRISVEKTVYKSKKMHLYADDLESTSDSNTDSKDNQNSWKRKRFIFYNTLRLLIIQRLN